MAHYCLPHARRAAISPRTLAIVSGIAIATGLLGWWQYQSEGLLTASLAEAWNMLWHGQRQAVTILDLDHSVESTDVSTATSSGEMQISEARKAVAPKVAPSTPHRPVVLSSTSTIASAAPPSMPAALPECSFKKGGEAHHKVLLNEIAWMGSREGDDEWIELRNNFGSDVSLANWQLVSSDDKIKIFFQKGETFPPSSFYVLARDVASSRVRADKKYNGSLANGGKWLKLFDASCSLSDEINASSGWPGGNAAKHTLERGIENLAWHTSAAPLGTPGTVNSRVALVSPPGLIPAPPPASPTVVSPPPATPPPPPSLSVPTYPLIIEVQIGREGMPDHDFIRLFNPDSAPVDISGWKLRKRTASGSESSIRTFPEGSVLQAADSFLWANSKEGFDASAGAQVSSTQTLAINNSVALTDADNRVIDAVAWGQELSTPFIEGSAARNPEPEQVLKRRFDAGVPQDTGNNAADFLVE